MGTSPAFTCRSSFSTFLVDNNAPCSLSGGFSFSSCCESAAPEFPSPVPSLLSFTFFSPSSEVEKGNHLPAYKANLSTLDATSGESSLSKALMFSDSPPPLRHDIGETEHRTEIRRGGQVGPRLQSSTAKGITLLDWVSKISFTSL